MKNIGNSSMKLINIHECKKKFARTSRLKIHSIAQVHENDKMMKKLFIQVEIKAINIHGCMHRMYKCTQ